MKTKKSLRSPRKPAAKPKKLSAGHHTIDQWEEFVADAIQSIATSLASIDANMMAQTETQDAAHAVFMADAKLRAEQHAMLLESEKIGKARLEEVRRLEAEGRERAQSSVAREQATLAEVKSMSGVVKKALAGGDGGKS